MIMVELFHTTGGESIKVPADAVVELAEKGWLPAKPVAEQKAEVDVIDTQETE
jgi:hypothetical protein